jgi:hypothetical protein
MRSMRLFAPLVSMKPGVTAFTRMPCGPTYGSLATYVTQHALAIHGPIREYYLISGRDIPDETAWRTEIGWPTFSTGERA